METYKNPSFGDRIRKLRGDLNQSQYAVKIGVTQPTVTKYERGMVPNADILLRIGRLHNKSVKWLLEGDVSLERTADISSYTLIPLYNVEASAGGGEIPIDESVREYIPLKIAWLKAELRAGVSGVLAVPVSGDSMKPTMADGDLVLIEKTSEIRDDAIYVFRRGDHVYVKRLQALPGGRFEVISDNVMYKPYTVDPEQFPEYSVIGRVIWHGRNL